MDRVSGRYKRRIQTLLFWAGLATAVALNLDAITITQALARDHALRAVAVAQAEKATAPSAAKDGEDAAARTAALSSQIREIGYPVGWRAGWPKPQSEPRLDAQGQCVKVSGRSEPSKLPVPLRALANGFASEPNSLGCRYDLGWKVVPMIVGWLATALAVMLGAPFWFDVLNRIMIVRSTIKPDQKSPPEAPPEGYPPGYPAHIGPAPLAAGRPDDPPPAVNRNQ